MLRFHNQMRAGGEQGARLLFVHGFLGEAADWSALRAQPALRGAGACFELPGHGAATPVAAPDGDWFPEAADRLKAACAALPAPPVVVGYSMGGRLALYTTVRFAEAASGLIVLGADPGLGDPAARAARRDRDEALAQELEATRGGRAFAEWLRRWYGLPLFGNLSRSPQFGSLLQRRLRQNPAALAAALRGLSVSRQPPLWDALPRLTIPALFIAGSDDAKYRRIAKRIADLGGPWRAAVCPGAAHAVHLEQPEAVAGLIHRFVANRVAPRGTSR